MPEIPLGEPLVVRLREDLRRKQLVRDLCVRSPFERVVDDVPEWLPVEQVHACPRRSFAELVSHIVVPLGIDEDDPWPRLMAASANRSIKIVLPDPVAPTISAMTDRAPAIGTLTSSPSGARRL
jgi:hypothetical protein